MRNILAVFEKEMRAYFGSPIAYVVTTVFLVISGFFFYNMLVAFNLEVLRFESQGFRGSASGLNLNEFVVTNLFGVISFTSLLIVPFLTMRLFAEEKKLGTIELLMTSPLKNTQTLLGKFLACITLYTVMMALTLVYLLILEIYGKLDWGPIFSSYLGIILMGAVFVSVGIFASSLTENQIVAVAVTFCTLLIFWVIGWSSQFVGPKFSKILSYIWIIDHLRDFEKGVIDTKGVVFYISFCFFGLFLTNTVLESRRWRG